MVKRRRDRPYVPFAIRRALPIVETVGVEITWTLGRRGSLIGLDRWGGTYKISAPGKAPIVVEHRRVAGDIVAAVVRSVAAGKATARHLRFGA